MGVPVHGKQVFTGVLRISNKFAREETGVPVTQEENRENCCIWKSKYFESDLLREQPVCVIWLTLFVTCWGGRSGGIRMVWHDPFICVTRLILMCDMPHPYVRNMTQFYSCREGHSRAIGMLWDDPFICVTWLINVGYATTHHHGRRRSDST